MIDDLYFVQLNTVLGTVQVDGDTVAWVFRQFANTAEQYKRYSSILKAFQGVLEKIIIIGELLETPRFSLETPIFLLETPYFPCRPHIFSLATPDFHWRPQIFIGDPQIFFEDPIFSLQTQIVVGDPHIVIGNPQMLIVDPIFLLETPFFRRSNM